MELPKLEIVTSTILFSYEQEAAVYAVVKLLLPVFLVKVAAIVKDLRVANDSNVNALERARISS